MRRLDNKSDSRGDDLREEGTTIGNRRNDCYSSQVAERPEWHGNLAAKLLIYGPIMGLPPDQINNAVADNLYLAYGLAERIRIVREFGPASTAALVTLATGTGVEPFVFTPYNAPALPTLLVGAAPVLPGALNRTSSSSK